MIKSIAEIEEMVDKEQFSPKMKIVVQVLLSAINDWPDPLDNFNDYDLAVKNFIKNATTKKNIELTLGKVDFSKYAWEVESLSVLLEVFDQFEEDISIKEIISSISPIQNSE